MRKVVVTRSLDLVGDEEDGLLHISRVDFAPVAATLDSAGQPVHLIGTLTAEVSDHQQRSTLVSEVGLPFDSHATELRNLLDACPEAFDALVGTYPAFDFTATEHVKIDPVAEPVEPAGDESQSSS